ncbi:hypothetical protein M9Y10_027509 [Tritrichomonas musculus]|uniref:DUF4201 domain-containing protein n=1 Tax=Tritrichomonas musculus TaxID=1915356 RepID=A0ABR2GJD9_9EUKA
MKTIAQGFQFRIQEELDVKDEQIDRLSDLLVSYKEKILEYKQQIVILNNQIEKRKKELDQRIRDKQVVKGVSRSQKVSAHQIKLIQIQAEQNQEIQELQKDFAQKLSRFHEFSNEQMQDQEKSFDIEFQKVKKEIAETQSKIANFKKPEEKLNTSSLQVQNDVIKHLQKVVEEKSEERRSMLLDFKMQFTDYLAFINNIDAQHQKSVSDIQTQIEENTKIYNESLHVLKKKRHHDLKALHTEKKEAEKKLHSLTSQLSQMKEQFTQSCNFTTKKFDAMKSLSYPKSHSENVPQNIVLSHTKEKLMKSIENRNNKELQLKKVREENFDLKKQITILRHSRRYPYSK